MSFIALGQIQIKQHEGGRPQGLLLGKMVHDIERVVTIIDDLELVRERLGIEYLANELDVCRITVHDNDAQRRCRSIHTCHSSGVRSEPAT